MASTQPRRAHDFEEPLGDGQVRIFEGHPRYCQQIEPHEPHRFDYIYLDHEGNRTEGFYDCDGQPISFRTRAET